MFCFIFLLGQNILGTELMAGLFKHRNSNGEEKSGVWRRLYN